MFRVLTEAEIQTVVDEEWLHRFWREHGDAFARFARDIYGPAATSVEMQIGSWYTDEYYISLPHRLIVRDAAGQECAPDLATAWWAAHRVEGGAAALTERQRTAMIDVAHAALTRDLDLPLVPALHIPLAEPPLTFLALYRTEGDDDTLAGEPPPTGVGGFRPATEGELAALVAAYHEDYAWRSMVAFARDIYGLRAAMLDFSNVGSIPRYHLPSIGEIVGSAFDKDGRELEPDLTTPWWRAVQERHQGAADDAAWHARQIAGYFTVLAQPDFDLGGDVDYMRWLREQAPDGKVRTDRPPIRGLETIYVPAAEHPTSRTGFRQYPIPPDPEYIEELIAEDEDVEVSGDSV